MFIPKEELYFLSYWDDFSAEPSRGTLCGSFSTVPEISWRLWPSSTERGMSTLTWSHATFSGVLMTSASNSSTLASVSKKGTRFVFGVGMVTVGTGGSSNADLNHLASLRMSSTFRQMGIEPLRLSFRTVWLKLGWRSRETRAARRRLTCGVWVSSCWRYSQESNSKTPFAQKSGR